MTDETVDAPEPEETPDAPETPEVPTPGEKDDKPAEVDPESLTDAEKEFHKPGQSLAETRKALAEAYRSAKGQTPGLSRADFEELLDSRLSALKTTPEEEPDSVKEIKAELAERGREFQMNEQELGRIEREFNKLQGNINRLEGSVEATDDPDKKNSLERQLDRARGDLERSRQTWQQLKARNRNLVGEYNGLQKQITRAQQESQREREAQKQEAADQQEKQREYSEKFRNGYVTSAKTEIPEELRDRVFAYVEGRAVVTLKNRTDRSGTDLAALASDLTKELVEIHKAWNRIEAKRPKGPVVPTSANARPASRVTSPTKPTPNAHGVEGMRQIPSRAQAKADWEANLTRARG